MIRCVMRGLSCAGKVLKIFIVMWRHRVKCSLQEGKRTVHVLLKISIVANAPYNFDLFLRRCCDVVTSAPRFPSEAWDVIVDNNTLRKDTTGKPLNGSISYIKNAPGAAFDSFTVSLITRHNLIQRKTKK